MRSSQVAPHARPHLIRQTTTPSAGKRWWLAAFLLLGLSRSKRARVAHVVPGGRDPAIGALDVGDAERVDMAVEGIGDAAHVSPDAEGSRVEIDGLSVSLICATRAPLR